MGAYNVVIEVRGKCPRCLSDVLIDVQFKFGATWLHRYRVGDAIRWGANDVGIPGLASVVADGAAESPCPQCGYDGDWDFYVFLERDRIMRVSEADGSYSFVLAGKPFLSLGGDSSCRPDG